MTGTPTWISYLFAAAMLSVAAYGVALFWISVVRHDRSGRDVDVAHLFMGVAMAGMFVPRWAFWPGGFWEAVFGALLVWFTVRGIQSIREFGIHVPHQAIHATMSLAMLLMYWFPMAHGSPGGPAMAMGAGSSAGTLDPGVGLVLVVLFCWSAIFTLASPDKGASHHGRHRRAGIPVLAAASATAPTPSGSGPAGPEAATVIASPRLEDLSHVVMCVAMAFMLVLMM